MTADAWITAAVLVATLGALAASRFPPAAVMVAATTSLLVLGVIDAGAAFSGFSNPAPLTVAALYVLARAAAVTGLLNAVTDRLLDDHDGPSAVARLSLPAAGASAFVSNTPLVAMLIPDVVSWAHRRRTSASQLLMPLSFATLLGGMATVLGTSTNLVVSGLLVERGMEPIGVFEMTPVGGVVALVGLVVLVALCARLVPRRATAPEQAESSTRDFVVSMEVVPGGPLDGATIAGAGLRDLNGVYLVDLERGAESITPPNPDVVLAGADRLTFAGRVDDIVDLQRSRGLRSTEQEHLLDLDSPSHTFFEAVVGGSSVLAGQTLKEARFRSRYQAAVVAIHRDGRRVDAKLGDVRLRPTDTLLVLARPGFAQRWRANTDFLVVALVGGDPPGATRRAPLVGLVALGIVVSSAVGALSILEASLLGAGALVATRVLSWSDARDAVDLDVIVLIAASFGLGAALESTGLAQTLAERVTGALGGFGTWGLVAAIVLVTLALSEVVTNNAAAVVVLPIALSVAGSAGLDLRAVAIAVAISASASFLSPIGYQTNTMVYGPGGYRFGDYARTGWPLTVAVALVVTTMTALVA